MAIDTLKKELESKDVQILVNGKRVALALECEIKSTRSAKPIKAFGEGRASAFAVGVKCYTLMLSRIELAQPDFDFESMSDFSVSIKKQGKTNTFSHCQWTELCEHIINGKSVIQKVTVTSPCLNVSEVL